MEVPLVKYHGKRRVGVLEVNHVRVIDYLRVEIRDRVHLQEDRSLRTRLQELPVIKREALANESVKLLDGQELLVEAVLEVGVEDDPIVLPGFCDDLGYLPVVASSLSTEYPLLDCI